MSMSNRLIRNLIKAGDSDAKVRRAVMTEGDTASQACARVERAREFVELERRDEKRRQHASE